MSSTRNTISLTDKMLAACTVHVASSFYFVQSPTPLVRLKTLRLMDVVLKRVAETVSVLKANEPGMFEQSQG